MKSNYSVLHDSFLKGIEMEGSGIMISLEGDDGVKYKLNASGVQAMLFDNVRFGNIILEIRDVDIPNASAESLSRLLFHKPHVAPDVLELKKTELSTGDFRLLSIQSSYGAEGLVLCKSHSLKIASD